MKELVEFLNWETMKNIKSALRVYHVLFFSAPLKLSCVFLIEKGLIYKPDLKQKESMA